MTCWEYTLATSIVVENGRAVAVETLHCETGIQETFRGRHIVVGTGGAGQLFKYTTNPEVPLEMAWPWHSEPERG